MPGRQAWTVAEGEFVIEYGTGQTVRFSVSGDIAAEAEDSIKYRDPETADDITLPGRETWADIELERPNDAVGQDFFQWMLKTQPADRLVSAARSKPGGRLIVLSKARVSAPKELGMDLDGSDLSKIMCTLQYARPVIA